MWQTHFKLLGIGRNAVYKTHHQANIFLTKKSIHSEFAISHFMYVGQIHLKFLDYI